MLLRILSVALCVLMGHVAAQDADKLPLEVGQQLVLECIQRDEDGEAMEDKQKQRIYTPFLTCNETGAPPTLSFRQSTSRARIPCTVTIDDPTFHLFQAYLHHDIPLVCRLPSLNEDTSWAHIPVALLGKAELSHFDLEPKVNFVIHYHKAEGRIVGGTAYSVGPTITVDTDERDLGWERIKIGDEMKFEFSVRWISTEEVANEHSHRGLNALHIMLYPFMAGIVFMLLCRVLYDVLWSRQKIASVRQQARFESAGINMTKGRGKRARDMA